MADRESIRTQTRRGINEEDATNSHYTDAELNDYINISIEHLSSLLDDYEKMYDADIQTGKRIYSFDNEITNILNVLAEDENSEQYKVYVVEENYLDSHFDGWRTADNGKIRYAYIADKFNLGVHPTADTPQNGLKLYLKTSKVPDRLTSDDETPQVPLPYRS